MVSVMGVAGRKIPGIKAAQKAFVASNRENGDAILNVMDGERGVKNSDGEPLTENDPRPAYTHAQFPMMVYHAKHEPRVVEDEVELDVARDEGYRLTPYPVVKVAVADPGIEKANLIRELKEKDGQITTLAAQLADLTALVNEKLGEVKRGPGRPRKTEPEEA